VVPELATEADKPVAATPDKVIAPDKVVATAPPAVAAARSPEPMRIDIAVGSEIMQAAADRPDSFSTRIGARLGIDAGIVPHLSARLATHLIPGDQNRSALYDVTLDVEGRYAIVPFVQTWLATGPAYGSVSITCDPRNTTPCPGSVSDSGFGASVRGGIGFGRGGFAVGFEAIYVHVFGDTGGFGTLTLGGTLSFGFSI
jgi:hypothetical protein